MLRLYRSKLFEIIQQLMHMNAKSVRECTITTTIGVLRDIMIIALLPPTGLEGFLSRSRV